MEARTPGFMGKEGAEAQTSKLQDGETMEKVESKSLNSWVQGQEGSGFRLLAS